MEWFEGRQRPPEPEVQEPVDQEPEVQEPEVQEPEVQEPEVQEPEVQEPEVQEPEAGSITEKATPRDTVLVRMGDFSGEMWGGFGEEFRRLRTRVVRAFGNERGKVILVTSSVPDEGKTTVACGLSRALAQASLSTLMVDSDLRNPHVHSLVGMPRGPGLSELLNGWHLSHGGVYADRNMCDVLTAGSPVESPAELIQGAFEDVIRDLAGKYDYTILDSPPVISVADSILLGHLVDGILFVVKNQSTPRAVVKEAVGQLKGMNILGIVYNNVPFRESYYKGYY